MHKETFYLDGIDARSAGIQLQAPIEFSEAVPVVEAQTIPGRNGDLIWETGSYENRSGSASCFCLQKDVEKAISSASRFLMGKNGYRRLETSDDPDHYWMARVENSPRIEQRLRMLAPFEIGFDCKPQRFVKSGDFPLEYSVDILLGLNVKIYNFYGFDAKPLILLKATDKESLSFGRVTINDRVCIINEFHDYLYLDCDLQNAYNNNGNMNLFVSCEEFPILESGENTISVYGSNIKSIEIVPRWWEL
jgi:phage-related protein